MLIYIGARVLTDEQTGRCCTRVRIVDDPLEEDEDDEVDKDGGQEDDFGDELEEDVDGLLEEPEKKIQLWCQGKGKSKS